MTSTLASMVTCPDGYITVKSACDTQCPSESVGIVNSCMCTGGFTYDPVLNFCRRSIRPPVCGSSNRLDDYLRGLCGCAVDTDYYMIVGKYFQVEGPARTVGRCVSSVGVECHLKSGFICVSVGDQSEVRIESATLWFIYCPSGYSKFDGYKLSCVSDASLIKCPWVAPLSAHLYLNYFDFCQADSHVNYMYYGGEPPRKPVGSLPVHPSGAVPMLATTAAWICSAFLLFI
jgi:hypothetical protein